MTRPDVPGNEKPESEDLNEQRKSLIITQSGEIEPVLHDVPSCENDQEATALLKILALGNEQIEQGRVEPVADVVKRLRAPKAGKSLST